MFDEFLPTEPTTSLVLSNLILLVLIFLLLKSSLRLPYSATAFKRKCAIFLMFVFVLFAFWGSDWFHYFVGYKELLKGDSGHMEDVYVWIGQNMSRGYLSFRFIIWGCGLLFVLLTMKRLPIKKDLALLFFGTIWIIWFSYARVSLGLAMAFWGLATIVHPYKWKISSYILAFIAISCSFYLHKSVFILILSIIVTFLSFKFNNKFYILLLFISVPLLVVFINNNVMLLFQFDVESSEGGLQQSVASAQYYLGQDSSSGTNGYGRFVGQILEPIPYVLLVVQSLLLLQSSIINKIPRSLQYFIRLHLIIVIIAFIFIFNYEVNTSILFVRILRFAAIPSAILLSYYWYSNFYPKLTKWTFRFAILSTLYFVLYSIHVS